jgi:hypothetical protein
MTSFGVIIDNQGTDESTPGTNAGSALGAAGANAGYIDHALKSGNYSAKNQLGMTLLGAALGSALDQPGQSKFHFRYAVKRLDGEISYYDVVQSDTFRHPVGVCVSVPAIQKIPQSVCQDSLDIFRQRYVTGFTAELTDAPKELLQSKPTDQMVECSVTNLPKFKTSLKKCISIGGSSNE